jgi:hypothetical protein
MNDTARLFFSAERVRNMIINPNPIFEKFSEREGEMIYNYMIGDESTTRAMAYEEFWSFFDHRGRRGDLRAIREVATVLRVFDCAIDHNSGDKELRPVKLFKLIDRLDYEVLLHISRFTDKQFYRALICALNYNVPLIELNQCILLGDNNISETLRVHMLTTAVYNNEVIQSVLDWVEE